MRPALALTTIALVLMALALILNTPRAHAHHGSVWIRMADCETGDGDGQHPYRADWRYNGKSGFDGGLQFSPGTWMRAARLAGVRYRYAYLAPAWVQIRVADRWRRATSWGQWPACSRKLGLR